MDTLSCLLMDCAKKMKNNLTSSLKQYNVTCRQALILRSLEKSQMTAKAIVDTSGIDKATLSVMLNKLKKNDIIKATIGKEDHREKLYSLSDKGEKILPGICSVEVQYRKNLNKILSKEEYEQLTSMLNKINNVLA